MKRLLPLLLVTSLALAACRGGRLAAGGGIMPGVPTAYRPEATSPVRQAVRPGQVNLSPRDLAPVDSFLHARNNQWILGDYAEVYASREYFATALTINTRVGLIQRHDRDELGDKIITLTYVGHPEAASAMANPRILIGTGLTVTARKRLVVRMVKTKDSRRPVYLRVLARGTASRGKGEKVLQRGDNLQLGGALMFRQGRWTWFPMRTTP